MQILVLDNSATSSVSCASHSYPNDPVSPPDPTCGAPVKRTVTRLTAAVTASLIPLFGMTMSTPAHADEISDFYATPASIPSTPGSLIKSAPMETLLNVWGKTTRIIYSSKNSQGQDVAVSGAYIEPWAKWNGPGVRPVVAFSSGTIGQGDQCAPSRLMTSTLGLAGGSFAFNYETNAMNNLLAKGVAVVVTDYVGLGTDGVHTYMNRVDQAHAVLDAARVANAVPGASVTRESKVATYGYSQGGGASGAAAELQPSYAPELKMAGAYVGAPPADLEATLTGIDGSSIVGAAGYFINGMAQSNLAVKNFVETQTNSAGKTTLATLAKQCIADSIFSYGFQKTSSWTNSGKSLTDLVAADPQLLAAVRQQRIGNLKPSVPVRVATGVADDVVPHAQAKQLAKDWCDKGVNVTYAPIPGVDLGQKVGTNHILPMSTDALTARDWVVARLTGQPVASNCSNISSMQ